MPGSELATYYVTLTAETSKIPGQIDKSVGEGARRADSHGRTIGSRLASGLGATFKAGAAAVGSVAALAIGTALRQGFQRLTAIDDAKGKLAGLGHSAESVAAIMDSALAAVKGTAYGLGDAATVAASAVAAGIKPGQELTKYLTLTADAATIAGTSLEEMGSIVNKVQTSGTVFTDNLNQLADRGIPIFQWLQDEYGVTADTLSEMVSKGEVDAETFKRVIETNIGGAAQSSGKTLRGAWENTKAALGRVGAAFLTPFLEDGKGGLGRLTTFIDSLTPKVETFAKNLRTGFAEFGNAFRSSGDSIDGTATKWERAGEIGRRVFDQIKESGSALVDFFKDPSKASFGDFIDSFKGEGGGLDSAASAGSKLTDTLGKLGSVAGDVGGELVDLAGNAGGVLTTALGAANNILGFFADHTTTATVALGGLTAAFLVAQGATVAFHIATAVRVAQAPAQMLVQRQLTVALGAHTAALTANTVAMGGNTAAAAANNAATATAAGGIGRWAKALGGATLAAAGVAVALVAMNNESDRAGEQQDIVADSADKLAKSQRDVARAFEESQGSINDSVLGGVSDQIATVRDEFDALAESGPSVMDKVGAGIFGLGGLVSGNLGQVSDAIGVFSDDTSEDASKVAAVFDSLKLSNEDMASKLLQSTGSYDKFRQSVVDSGEGGETAAEHLDKVRGTLQLQQSVAERTTPAFFGLRDAVKVLSDESSSASDRLNAMKQALDALAGKPVEIGDAMQNYNETLRDTADVVAQLQDQTKGYGAELDGGNGQINTATENGAKLRDTLKELRDSTADVRNAGGDLAPILAQNEEAFGQLAESTGLPIEKIREMAEEIGLVPGRIEMLAQLNGADDATAQLQIIKELLIENSAGIEIPTTALTDDTLTELRKVQGVVVEVDEATGTVKIRTDGQPQTLAEIQAVIDKRIPDKTVQVEANFGSSWDRLQQFAGAASVAVPAPRADGGIDHLPQDAVIAQGRGPGVVQWAEKETGGEGFIPLAQSKRGRSTQILGRIADLFGYRLEKFEDGGIRAALSAARSVDGLPYVWGGTSPAGFDCSGFVGWLQQIAMGIVGSTKRLYTTMSILGGATAQLVAGLGPSGTQFQVGVSQEHMAATIAGHNVESGGAHGTSGIDGGRAGARDGQFPYKFHLPNELLAGGAGNRSRRSGTAPEPWTPDDELDLQSATVAVEQEKEARDKVYADEDKTDADRRQADIDVQKAEQKVIGLQNKKDGIGVESDSDYVPEAPELERRYSDEEGERIDAEQAVEDAKQRRNETYADPYATEQELRKADADLSRALNALDEVGMADTDSSGEPKTIRDVLKKGFANFGSILVDAAFAQLPEQISQSRWFDIDFSAFTKKTDAGGSDKSRSFTKQDFDKQLGFNPDAGVPEWIVQLRKAPMKLFDQGGVMNPGDMGINLLKKPEVWLTPDEKSTIEQIANLNANVAPAVGGNIDLSINFDRPQMGVTEQEVQRSIRRAQGEQRALAKAFVGRTGGR
ncbi:tape measure protein [Antrihabitans sp. YC2-6]|uniref:tape measure protein n=1 Tax=Antrihabitans sp. YC2-6 TaxID=2799498 RepID=UPI0018F2D1AC|nr:tape measure protein [Antrihabitans sp. YC2-6]MBJ8344834.1 tape measure protein [Antrihabitans sp. YC2-6]